MAAAQCMKSCICKSIASVNCEVDELQHKMTPPVSNVYMNLSHPYWTELALELNIIYTYSLMIIYIVTLCKI